MTDECQHPEDYFDREVCAEPCGAMHYRCTSCGDVTDEADCPFAAKAADPTEQATDHGVDCCPDCYGNCPPSPFRAEVEALRAENVKIHDLISDYRSALESDRSDWAKTIADRDRLQAQVEAVRALCDNAEDPIYGWVSRNFDGSIAPTYVSVPNVRAALDQPPANTTAGEATEPDNEPCPEGRTDYDECFSPFRYCPVKGCGRAEGGRKL